jgi:hypothetical protein
VVRYILLVSTVAEISDAIAKLTAPEQIELLKSVAGHLKISPGDIVRSIDQNGSGVSIQNREPSARAMVGFAKRFHPDDHRSSDEILKELREGDAK